MKTIEEAAEEYANADVPFAYPCQEKHLIRAYRAGAKYALEMALKEIRAAESWADADGRVQNVARALAGEGE